MVRKHILFEEDIGPEWVVEYSLGYPEFDDGEDTSETTEIILNAINFDTAVRYAQQYLRKMQTDSETATEWESAEILSVQLR